MGFKQSGTRVRCKSHQGVSEEHVEVLPGRERLVRRRLCVYGDLGHNVVGALEALNNQPPPQQIL